MEINKKCFDRRKSLMKDSNIYIIEKLGDTTKIEYEYAWYSEKINNIIKIYNNDGLNLGFIKINSIKNKCYVYDINNILIFKYYCKKKLFNNNIKYLKYYKTLPGSLSSSDLHKNSEAVADSTSLHKNPANTEILKGVNNIYYPTPDRIYSSAKNVKFVRNNTDYNLPNFMSTSKLTVEKLTDKAHKILCLNENTNLQFVFQITRNYFKEVESKSNYYTVLYNNFLDLYDSYALALCCLYIY